MIEFEGQHYENDAGESVLECLLRGGVAVPSFCRSGACQSCILKATAGNIPAAAQVGLKPSLRQQGFFLSCLCRPTEGLSVERADAANAYSSRVIRVESSTAEVSRIFLTRPADFEFRAGQFAHLERPSDGLMRPYSIASLPDDDELELHVARLSGGRMSGWLQTAVGEPVIIRGPLGECFYQEGEPERPLLLAGTGTGLAPLYGILRQAARSKHSGPIVLYHGCLRVTGLYLRSELETLTAALPSLSLVGSVLERTALEPAREGSWRLESIPLDQLILSQHPKLNPYRVYLCGHPELVRGLRKRAYLAGAELDRIHCDAFASSPSIAPESATRVDAAPVVV